VARRSPHDPEPNGGFTALVVFVVTASVMAVAAVYGRTHLP
jgi:hypothetical protein